MTERPRRRRQSWNRSQSDGFRPIRQVGLAYSVGMPLMVVGVLLLAVAAAEGTTFFWALAAGMFIAGLLVAGSGRIT